MNEADEMPPVHVGRETLVVHGGGRHGRVVTCTALLCGWKVRETDDSKGTAPEPDEPCIIAIGDNAARKRNDRAGLLKIVHPEAYIDRTARLGPGCFVGPRAGVHVGAHVGRGAIVNTGACVEHDCTVGDWVHISPGAVLCGTVNVGEGAWIGANAVVKNDLTICPWAVIGCGSVVVKDITEPGAYVGNPARRINAK